MAQERGREREPGAGWGGGVVLCGLNELGYQVLHELRRLGEIVVVVARAPREEFAAGARALGATVLEGSYRQEGVLRSAGVATAEALAQVEASQRVEPAGTPE